MNSEPLTLSSEDRALIALVRERTEVRQCMNCAKPYPGAPADTFNSHGWRVGGLPRPLPFTIVLFCDTCGPLHAPELYA